MKDKLKGVVCLLCAAVCFLFPRCYVVTVADNSFDAQRFVEEASAKINQMREENGISPIPTALILQEMCGKRAEELTSLYSHSRPNGTPWYTILGEYNIEMRIAGENIAAGYDTPESVVEGWMNSAGHRKTILNENYNYFAIGIRYKENDPDYYFYYWDLIFFSSESSFENEYIPIQVAMTTETTTTTTETTTETTIPTTETTTEITIPTTETAIPTTETTTETAISTTKTTTETTIPTTEMMTETTVVQNNIIYGDCNLDEKVDLLDVILLNKYLAGKVGLTRKQMESANCNQLDGTSVVDNADADALLQFIILLVDKLPV